MPLRDDFRDIANSVNYDDSIQAPQLNVSNVQEAIDALKNLVTVSASPGFTWGRSGNVTSGTWLQNDTVPSNVAGRTIALANGKITKVLVSNEGVQTFDLGIYEHDGTTFTLLYTASVVAVRAAQFTVTGVTLTTGKELAIKIETGSGKNIVAGLILSGSVA